VYREEEPKAEGTADMDGRRFDRPGAWMAPQSAKEAWRPFGLGPGGRFG